MSWIETPRGLAIILTMTAVLSFGVSFWAGYTSAQTPSLPQVIVIVVQQ